jgi:hypothetical protein
MRSKVTPAVVLLVLALAVFNTLALLADAREATVTPNTKKKFMAGDQITQGGDIVGCLCPRTSGPCVCAIEESTTAP